jgi:hypothetical protein
MDTTSWQIKKWQPVEWYLPEGENAWPAFWHMGTSVVRADTTHDFSYPTGEALWMASVDGKRAAVAFTWVEVQTGVVVLSDPNALMSNIQFKTRSGTPMEPLAATVCLNRIVHRIEWQSPVNALLSEARGGQRQVLWRDVFDESSVTARWMRPSAPSVSRRRSSH